MPKAFRPKITAVITAVNCFGHTLSELSRNVFTQLCTFLDLCHYFDANISSGSEVEVVPDLLLTGAFAHIDATMIEWHERLAKLDERKKLSNNLQVQ